MIRKVLRSALLLINILTVFWLALCMFAAYHDTSKGDSILSLLSYSFAFALIANLIFIIIWLLFGKRKKKFFALLSLIAVTFSTPVSKSIIGIYPGGNVALVNENQQGDKRIKIMTYNVHYFDLGEWTKEKTTQRRIVDFIQNESPDILCLQEYYLDQKDPNQPFTEIIANLGYPYVEFTKQTQFSKKRMTSQAAPGERVDVGIAVFSKYPLEQKSDLVLPGNAYYKALTTDVKISDSFSFKLISAHLQSFKLESQDIDMIDKIKDPKELARGDKEKTMDLVRKLVKANQNRAAQANKIVEELEDIKGEPVIVCGDFNDIPGSYPYTHIGSILKDPFNKKGFGFARTYTGIFPTLRIDHILYHPDYFEPLSYEVIRENLSDHFPVVVEFSLRTKNNK